MMNVVWCIGMAALNSDRASPPTFFAHVKCAHRLSVPANIIRACQMRTQQVEYRCSTDSVCDLMYLDTTCIGYWNFTYWNRC